MDHRETIYGALAGVLADHKLEQVRREGNKEKANQVSKDERATAPFADQVWKAP